LKYLWKHVFDMPPSWLVLFIVIVWQQSRLWNPLAYGGTVIDRLGWALIVLGLLIMVWAFLQFLSHKTSIVPRNIPNAFIAAGSYKFSRNPIYLADTLVLFGFTLLMGSVIGLLLVPVFMWVIFTRFIQGEEAGLRATYPEAFETFCATTRRWL